MKAAILVEQNKPLVIDEISTNELDYGQVLVRVEVSSICGRQIGEITGAKGEDKFLPHLLGHEGGGVVEEIGPGVTTVKAGDKVVMHWRKGNGIESNFPKYLWNNDVIGGGLVTTLGEYSVVSENRLTPVPSSIPSEIAALFGCAVTTALGLVNNEARLKIGQSIAVIGTGGVGLNIIQAAALVTANPIIAIDIQNERLQMAMQLGATHSINNKNNDLVENISKIAGSKGVDVIVDTSGVPELIEVAYRLTAPGGRMIMVGQPHFSKSLTIKNFSNNFTGKTIKDSEGGATNPVQDIPRYIKLFEDGKLELEKIITNRYRLDDINLAIKDLQSGHINGKCIIEMN